jgi:multiple sugar transport system permease protein
MFAKRPTPARNRDQQGYTILLLMAAIPFVLPFVWLISMSLRPASEIYTSTRPIFAWPVTLENFRLVRQALDLPLLFRNTIMISLLSSLGCVLSSSLAGFAFATIRSRASNSFFKLTLLTIMVPAGATLIPLFVLFSRLGWINTFLPLIVPPALGNAFYIFLFRQYFRTLPSELFASAELDGCNPWMAYWYIGLPLARPALAAVAVFSFLASWNDFLNPLVYLHTPEMQTLSLGLASLQGFYFTQTHLLLPVSVLSILPVLALYGIAHRNLVQGISAAGWAP